MAKANGKTDGHLGLKHEDLEHELPAAETLDESGLQSSAANPPEVGAASEAEKLKAERDALLDRLARLQAEFDNARKRAAREQQDFREFAAADVIKNFLPALDSFERALKSAGDATDFRNGVDLIYRQFQDALQKSGVQPIAAVGQVFDPRVHEAVEMVDTTGVPDQHVVDELQRGYKYKDRLLRPAMVRVARNGRG
ncbi:MAG: nucleotide exchange factor GrpE [Terriglobales bacterium]|jgi:molecular chaperone GrpE